MKPRKRKTQSPLTAALVEISNKANLLRRAAGPHPSVFEQQAVLCLSEIARRMDDLLCSKLTFEGTEQWRSVYRQVLESCETRRYLSVALIRSDNYWRDAPGENSLEFNYTLVEHGFTIQRIFIVDPFFWPPSAKTPAREVMRWISAQHDRGILTSLVRLSDLDNEPDLVCDIGIYGDQAVGIQESDFEGRTVRFNIYFDANRVQEAEELWSRIELYATPMGVLAA